MGGKDQVETTSIPYDVGSARIGDEIWEQSENPGAARPDDQPDDGREGGDRWRAGDPPADGRSSAGHPDESRLVDDRQPILGQPPASPQPDGGTIGADPATEAARHLARRSPDGSSAGGGNGGAEKGDGR